MPKYANASNAYVISDRSGFRYRFKDTRKEWNGLLVGKDEYEEKHPQLDPKHNTADAEALRDARPERSEPSIEVIEFKYTLAFATIFSLEFKVLYFAKINVFSISLSVEITRKF